MWQPAWSVSNWLFSNFHCSIHTALYNFIWTIYTIANISSVSFSSPKVKHSFWNSSLLYNYAFRIIPSFKKINFKILINCIHLQISFFLTASAFKQRFVATSLILRIPESDLVMISCLVHQHLTSNLFLYSIWQQHIHS